MSDICDVLSHRLSPVSFLDLVVSDFIAALVVVTYIRCVGG